MVLTDAYLSDRAVNSGIKRGSMRISEGFLEIICPLCREFFPHTLEFFHKDGKGRLKTKCKPCCYEKRHHTQIPKTTLKGRPPKK